MLLHTGDAERDLYLPATSRVSEPQNTFNQASMGCVAVWLSWNHPRYGILGLGQTAVKGQS